MEEIKITQAICEAFGSLGWTVDMIVDYGSHARGEARKDSDYDVNIYVHRPGWLYLFEEYAQRLVKQEDEVVRWHRQIRQYFSGYKELSGELEQRAREVVKAKTSLPFYVTNVFDTRLVLYNMVRETWELFSLVHGRSIGNWPVYDEIISFLKRTRPFHHRFVEVHLGNCFMAAEQATSALANNRGEPEKRRFAWLTCIIPCLRNYVSLFRFVQGDWFTFGNQTFL
jgi:predicted nucleotidyltransferase